MYVLMFLLSFLFLFASAKVRTLEISTKFFAYFRKYAYICTAKRGIFCLKPLKTYLTE